MAYCLLLFLPEWKGAQSEETADEMPQNGRGDVGQVDETPALLPVQVMPSNVISDIRNHLDNNSIVFAWIWISWYAFT